MGQRDRKPTSSWYRGGSRGIDFASDGWPIGMSTPELTCEERFKNKSINIKVDKTVFIKLKILLFRYDLSLYEVLESIILEIVNESPTGLKFLNNITRSKVKSKVEGINIRPDREIFDENDIDALYDMMAEEDGNKK